MVVSQPETGWAETRLFRPGAVVVVILIQLLLFLHNLWLWIVLSPSLSILNGGRVLRTLWWLLLVCTTVFFGFVSVCVCVRIGLWLIWRLWHKGSPLHSCVGCELARLVSLSLSLSLSVQYCLTIEASFFKKDWFEQFLYLTLLLTCLKHKRTSQSVIFTCSMIDLWEKIPAPFMYSLLQWLLLYCFSFLLFSLFLLLLLNFLTFSLSLSLSFSLGLTLVRFFY